MSPTQLTPEQLNDVFEWDVSTWSHAYTIWHEHLSAFKGGKGLELGGRRGGLSLLLALHGIQATCSDLESPQDIARPLHEKHHVAQFIQYTAVDALHIAGTGTWDVIVFKSVVGALGRVNGSKSQEEVFRQIHRALRPGGMLLFAENLSGSPLHRSLRRAFVPWGKSWRYPTVSELHHWLEPFEHIHLQTTGFFSAFGRSEKQRRWLAAIDKLFLPLCPSSWRYVAIGVAYKPQTINLSPFNTEVKKSK